MKAKLKCPACGSSRAYMRIRTREIVCQECGTITKDRVKAKAA
jgi:transcription initiation factor TFIIIB Brf1 subunit/transcription initiation factor TFIIB